MLKYSEEKDGVALPPFGGQFTLISLIAVAIREISYGVKTSGFCPHLR